MNISVFEWLILAIATWRLSHLLVSEDGPFDILFRFRKLIGFQVSPSYPLDETDFEWLPQNKLAELFACVWCISIWIGLGFYVGFMITPTTTLYVALPLSLSAIAVVINLLTELLDQ